MQTHCGNNLGSRQQTREVGNPEHLPEETVVGCKHPQPSGKRKECSKKGHAQTQNPNNQTTLIPDPRKLQDQGGRTEGVPLAKGPEHAFQAFKFTKDREPHNINPLRTKNGNHPI
ncbi:hypothetical protein O181_004491 [Austropuccinia psidii MF-1]|uniref:Uncharacterized protein n=1 Tax=Austropuccinia psidii MF-1 TaxID=1389203 RepID=A0A9Q3BFN1_9BASI|nr:hypothetical protein [Austropuccinia psidii MF-1]